NSWQHYSSFFILIKNTNALFLTYIYRLLGIVIENRSKDQAPKKGGSKTQNKGKKNTKNKKKNSKSKPEPTTESTAKDEARKVVRFKTACREGRLQLQRYIESMDVILVVLDARDPQRCRSRFLEQWAQEN